LCILIVYRIGVAIPIPGINVDVIRQFFSTYSNHNGLINFLDIFSGGALNRMSIFSMGIVPYVNASIIVNLIQGAHIIPYLDKLTIDGEHGRKRINKIIRYLTLLLGIIQSIILIITIKKIPMLLVINASISWYILVIITLITGLMFVTWLGEQITEYGIGNGISLIILIGIIERLPSSFYKIYQLINTNIYYSPLLLLLLLFIISIIFILVIWIETAQRQIPIHYTKKLVEHQLLNDQKSFLPIKIDQSGVMAVIFTISILAVPLTIAQLFPKLSFFGYLISQKIIDFNIKTNVYYNVIFTCLVTFFCYFYNSISFNPNDISQHMKKFGGFIPGIRSGKPTQLYIKYIMDRLTLVGAIFISCISILPNYLKNFFHITDLFSGTSLLITIGVILDLIAQVESYFVMKQYENFISDDGNAIMMKYKNKIIAKE
jgi:preprotein translocase subunit SecY